jgi:CBS-domain-containing membrane protein
MSHPALSTYRFAEGTCIAQATPPEAARVSLDSPATAVMTDLVNVRAACIGPQASLDAAEQRMRESGVRMLFVISDMPCVDGIVTLSDLQGSKPIRLIQAQGLTRTELTVKHVMQALSDIDAVDFEALGRATVGSVVAALQHYGHAYLLAVEAATRGAPPRIRGIFSAAQVERQLGVPLNSVEVAATFAEIATALRG